MSEVAVTQYFQDAVGVLMNTGLRFDPKELPGGVVGTPYDTTIRVSGGLKPYSVTSTAVVPGLVLTSQGRLVGTPSAQGTFLIPVSVNDSKGCFGIRRYRVTIEGP